MQLPRSRGDVQAVFVHGNEITQLLKFHLPTVPLCFNELPHAKHIRIARPAL
jgi:hypothetical protein